MEQSSPKIAVQYVGDVVLVVPTDEKLLEEPDIQALEDSILPLVEDGTGVELVISFENVKFLSSAVLGLLIRLSKKVYENQGKMHLCCIDQKIYEIFKITRLDKVFEIYDSRDEAVSSF
ncbi:Anti-anti-sigma-B factor [Anaerohalosphaera lusitana]|uniref:Anti-sigma factor antagonist n=1 Tax=Anaerohalosphaera lusitana TaxID=1936003 RepID=A0A1U9NN20_9BACT|nr:STAS domain-containing protein [Anaerohalosphaera lusitana]AQT69311.1 Anti-anti-sigma-B factor [Anaerohalosphaera lusitana]